MDFVSAARPRLKRHNRLIARRRAAVEPTFAILKHRMQLSLYPQHCCTQGQYPQNEIPV